MGIIRLLLWLLYFLLPSDGGLVHGIRRAV